MQHFRDVCTTKWTVVPLLVWRSICFCCCHFYFFLRPEALAKGCLSNFSFSWHRLLCHSLVRSAFMASKPTPVFLKQNISSIRPSKEGKNPKGHCITAFGLKRPTSPPWRGRDGLFQPQLKLQQLRHILHSRFCFKTTVNIHPKKIRVFKGF